MVYLKPFLCMVEPQIAKEFGDAMTTTHQVQMIERPSDFIGMSLAHILELVCENFNHGKILNFALKFCSNSSILGTSQICNAF